MCGFRRGLLWRRLNDKLIHAVVFLLQHQSCPDAYWSHSYLTCTNLQTNHCSTDNTFLHSGFYRKFSSFHSIYQQRRGDSCSLQTRTWQSKQISSAWWFWERSCKGKRWPPVFAQRTTELRFYYPELLFFHFGDQLILWYMQNEIQIKLIEPNLHGSKCCSTNILAQTEILCLYSWIIT